MQSARDLIVEANRKLIIERNPSSAADFFATQYTVHVGKDDVRITSPRFVEDFVGKLLKAFPDLGVEVEILATSEDRAAWMRTCSGTHEANFMGLPPSGRRLTWRDMLVSRVENGKIAEEWHVSNIVERFISRKKDRE